MIFKVGLLEGLVLLILISSGIGQNVKNKPTKPIFPNLVLPSPPTQNQEFGNPLNSGALPPSDISKPAEPCPNPSDHFHEPQPQYPGQLPPQQLQQPDPNLPHGEPELPPVPELFRKSTTTPQPSLFQKSPPKDSTPKPEVSSTPVPKRLKDDPSPQDKIPPRISEPEAATTTEPPKTTTEPPKTTTEPPFSRTTTAPPKQQNELFPRLDKMSNERTGKKLNFKGLPEPGSQAPSYPQPQQPPFQQQPPLQSQPPFQQQPPFQLQPPFQPQPQPIQNQFGNEKPVNRQQSATPSIMYKIAIVADLGRDARVEDGRFKSFLKEGNLIVQKSKDDPKKFNVTIDLDENAEPQIIESRLNNDNEGFELSTLNIFNGKLYSCDDETGIVYELKQIPKETSKNEQKTQEFPNNRRLSNAQEKPEKNTTYIAQPWLILSNEGEDSGFRCEWATVKDEHLWIGSTGILVRKSEEEVNDLDKTRQGVKKVSLAGGVEHLDWTKNYEKISEAIGLPYHKGFAVHEGVAWSDILQRWLFTPRRISKDKYDKKVYDKRGANTAIFADDNFEDFKMEHWGELVETAGFTSIKFIPGTEDRLILALKAGLDPQTNELKSTLEVFDIDGEQVTHETPIGKGIYAGVEFV